MTGPGGASDAVDVYGLVVRVVRAAAGPDASDSLADALLQVPAARVADFFHPHFDRNTERIALTTGLPAAPGAACGRIVLDAASAINAAERGESVILVRDETSPEDVVGMQSARGVLTTRGGLASHAAVVARGWGIPAVVGATGVAIRDGGIEVAGCYLPEGTEISIDGGTGEVIHGRLPMSRQDPPPELDQLLRWADSVRAGRVAVRANVDTAADAETARQLGAEGIGLCRTEHMFLAPDRLPLIRRFILSDDPDEEATALSDLESAQERDFAELLTAMHGLPITIRLLDPPLHEFLPDLEPLIVAAAKGPLAPHEATQLAALRRLREQNPMLGTRGVRLGVVKPGLYQMQVRAICRAIQGQLSLGRSPRVELLIPFVVSVTEMAMARRWVMDAFDETRLEPRARESILIGAMVETPRAALVAGQLTSQADFLSFGTNDLTQLTFAFSRDDVEAELLPRYLESGVLQFNPFAQLDPDGVGRLISLACRESRSSRPDLKLGVCGEHAGDAPSARLLVDAGVDYVSCSPYRLPVARLAIAQALLESGRVSGAELSEIPATERVPTRRSAEESSKLVSAVQVMPEQEFSVIHALRVKGFAGLDTLSEVSGVPIHQVGSVLQRLLDRGYARHFARRDLWQLTPRGCDHHAALVTQHVGPAAAELQRHYDAFLPLNARFKAFCTAWQLREGDQSEQSGRDSAATLGGLEILNEEVQALLGQFAHVDPRLASYRVRLTAAARRVLAGDTRSLTGVMCDSYHDVWMELHEDLVQLLRIDRTEEESE